MNWRNVLAANIEEFEARSENSPFKEILVLAWLVGEIENGGLIQYLENEVGADFQRARDAAISVGDADVGMLLDDVASRFPNGLVPVDATERTAATERLCAMACGNDPFDAETRRFSELQPALEANMNRWLQVHSAATESDSVRSDS